MAMHRVALWLRCLLAMLMLRKGGRFTDQQIRKYSNKVVVCFAIAVVGIFVMRYIQIPLIGLITTLLAITLFRANLTRWGNWFVSKRGGWRYPMRLDLCLMIMSFGMTSCCRTAEATSTTW